MPVRVVLVITFVATVFGCGHRPTDGNGRDAGVDAPIGPADACTGLGCDVFDCAPLGQPPTSVSGTVYAPNGTLPLYNVAVYVPASDPGPLPTGLSCDRCTDGPLGGAIAQTVTDASGHFTLSNVPSTSNVPIVIQVGKWRRQLVLPTVPQCTDTPIGTADTSLPKSIKDATPNTALDTAGNPKVDLPKIAISTGMADALECLVLKLGIDPSEMTTAGGTGHVQLYTDSNAFGSGASVFQPNWPGSVSPAGDAFGQSETLWSDYDHLAQYDIVMLSCEGAQYSATKPLTALDAMEKYTNAGGRLFASHWHNIWIGGVNTDENGAPPVSYGEADWEAITTFNFDAPQNDDTQVAVIDQTVTDGSAFAQWMVNNGGSTTPDQVVVNAPRYTLAAADSTQTSRMVWVDPASELPTSNPKGETDIQDLLFTTPVGAAAGQQCGKVVFSDMHVSQDSMSMPDVPFPDLPPDPTLAAKMKTGCDANDLSPQEKALAFIFFDIASCVQILQ